MTESVTTIERHIFWRPGESNWGSSRPREWTCPRTLYYLVIYKHRTREASSVWALNMLKQEATTTGRCVFICEGVTKHRHGIARGIASA